MKTRRSLAALLGAGALALAMGAVATKETPAAAAAQTPNGAKPAAEPADRPADREAVRQASREFQEAFNRGDAKAVAALWTENCLYSGDDGSTLRGRAALEKAFAEHFQAHPKLKMDVAIGSIQFPARDAAIEEGTLRTSPGVGLPTSTRYSTLLVREDGKWRIAWSREWGEGEDQLHDLSWLIGEWAAEGKEGETRMSFAWNGAKTQILGKYSFKAPGRLPDDGAQIISLDPVTGRIRSWFFDEAGGRGEALWRRDGDRWALDSVGVLPNGVETAAVNLIARVNDDEFIWRSAGRIVGGLMAPDTLPLKVKRVKSGK